VKRALGNRAMTRSFCTPLLALSLVLGITGCTSVPSSTQPPDTTPPTAPANLVATVVSSTQINLSWAASTDNVGVTGYKVERCQGAGCSNFAQIAAPTGTTFNDTGLTASTPYSYRVHATDAANNLSAYSTAASATTAAPSFTAPSNLTATAAGPTQINLSWTVATETGGTISQYLIERCAGAACNNFAQVGTSATNTFSDTGLTPSANYSYRVRATDAANNFSPYSNTASAATLVNAPTAPANLKATSAGPVQINLSWTAATETGGTISQYLIERCTGVACGNFAQMGTSATTTFNDPGRLGSTSYSYRVRAMDTTNNTGPYSNTASATTAAPTFTAPSNLVATAAGNTQINLSWTAATETGGTPTNYLIERCTGSACSNFAQVGTSATTTFSNIGLLGSTSYSYRVRATDASNNFSAYSNTSSATTAAPSFTAPSNLTATAAGPAQINLSWAAATETGGTISQYLIERCAGAACNNFAQVGTSATTTFNDTGLTASTAYSYRVRATDAANNLGPYSSTATASTPASAIIVSISPKRGGVATSQTLPFTASVAGDVGGAGVTWTKTGGTFANSTLTSVTFSSTAAGSFMITATSNADNTKSASATIGVTDLAGVPTYHNDLSRDGVNSHEFALTAANVNTATFGKLFSCPVDGEVYAQPLWVPNLSIGGGNHNVIFVATQNDSVYAFDADATPSCHQYWQKSFLSAGVTAVPFGDTATDDINKKIGITGTPVIDPVSKTLYVVAKTKEGTANYHQRLHALNLVDGSDKVPAFDITPAITASGSGDTGDSSVGCTSTPGNVPFCPLREGQRPGLALVNGVVYVAWASHGDNQPYHGWIMGFNASTLALVANFNDSPDGREGGIWMSGGAPAVDASNNLYVITGNGDFNANSASPPNQDYGDSFLKLTSALSVADYFTPSNQGSLDGADLDLGSGGAVVIVDLPATAPHQHLLVGGGKGSSSNGDVFVLDRDNMGHFNANTNNIVQTFSLGGAIFSTAAFWQNWLYIGGVGQALEAFALNPSTSQFNTAATSHSSASFGFPGTTPSVSSSGTTNGIVWALDTNNTTAANASGVDGPAVLHAYDALNLGTELYHSDATSGGANAAGNAVKFCVPTIANGKVYVGTQAELTVFGLLP
jgi:chitodextrinase